jgi:hypothetical protein
VMQDNQAVIINLERGFRGRTKPINVKYHFVRELVEEGKVKLVKIDTSEMIADVLTKPFYSPTKHVYLLQRLLNDDAYNASYLAKQSNRVSYAKSKA